MTSGLQWADASTLAQNALDWLTSDGLRILATIVTLLVTRYIAFRAIDSFVAASVKTAEKDGTGVAGKLLTDVTGVRSARHEARVRTVGSLLKSVVTFILVVVGLLTVFALVGIPLGPLLASAGIGGVAVGFGAQSLVKDFLSGLFMITEDQYGVGDVIDTGEAVGTVEEVTLRITKLRDAKGVTWYVRNGEIVRIGNTSQGWQASFVDIPVAYTERVDRVIPVVTKAAEALYADEHFATLMVQEPTVLGVESVTATATTIRTEVRCVPGASGEVTRALRERIKDALTKAGIAGPPTATGAEVAPVAPPATPPTL